MVAGPALTPRTRPLASTTARAASRLDQDTGAVTVLPKRSFTVAVSCTTPPTGMRSRSGEIATVSTSPGTAIARNSTLPIPGAVAYAVEGPALERSVQLARASPALSVTDEGVIVPPPLVRTQPTIVPAIGRPS